LFAGGARQEHLSDVAAVDLEPPVGAELLDHRALAAHRWDRTLDCLLARSGSSVLGYPSPSETRQKPTSYVIVSGLPRLS
jgi:hypothetical protein